MRCDRTITVFFGESQSEKEIPSKNNTCLDFRLGPNCSLVRGLAMAGIQQSSQWSEEVAYRCRYGVNMCKARDNLSTFD